MDQLPSLARLIIRELKPAAGQPDRLKIAVDALRASFLARYPQE